MIKTANVGSFDRAIRLIAGILLIIAPFVSSVALFSNPVVQWVAPLIGLVLVLTAYFRFCPLYRLIGASTCKAE